MGWIQGQLCRGRCIMASVGGLNDFEKGLRARPPGCTRLRGWQSTAFRRVELRAFASDSEFLNLQEAIEQVEKMRASAIKDELNKLGILYTDCFEKQELVVRLATARLQIKNKKEAVAANGKPGKVVARMPMTRLRSTQDSPKEYILVPLKINNQGPFNFILDTASTITLIAPTVVYDKLRLTPGPAQQTLGLFGGGASNQSFLSVNLSEVRLGDHVLSAVNAVLMDANMLQRWDPSAVGILGLNLLSQFDVEFDNSKKEMIFHTAGAVSRGECNLQGLEKLSTSAVILGILSVKVALGRAPPEMALLDLGSSLCVASPDIARLAGIPENIITGNQPTIGGGGIGQVAALKFSGALIDVNMITEKKGKETAAASDFTLRGAQFAIGDVPAIRAVGCRILLGVNLFKHGRMIFSQSSKSVYMERPPTAAR